jgi:enoyl-CoA hydratase
MGNVNGEPVVVARRESVAVVRLNRPPANALDLDAIERLGSALVALGDDDSIGAVVLTGTGSFFSAGLDVKSVASYSKVERQEMVQRINQMICEVYALPIPLVAGINGHAVAGGLVCALLCDQRIGIREAGKIGLTEARVGIPFPVASLEVIRAEIEPSLLRRMVLTGRSISTTEAYSAGILDELVEAEKLLQRAEELALEVGSMPRSAYRQIKTQLRGPVIARLQQHVRGMDSSMAEWIGASSS